MMIVLLGPPGAGKGTQCKRIIDEFSLVHLSSGDILRSERAAGTELGKQAQEYMDSGALVPDDLIIKMMVGAINKAGGNCVLDGFPRTVVQAEALDKALAENNQKIDAVVNLEIADEEVAWRLTGRRSCSKCGAVYHIETLKPKNDNKCDNSCGELVQRDDDKPEVVENRLKTYHDQTEPVLGYYRNTGAKIIDIDASKGINEITTAIISRLSEIK